MFFFIIFSNACAQSKFWVTFCNKANVVFDPCSYFDNRVIVQRKEHNISIIDSTDFPINPGYLLQISANVTSVSCTSRWLNGVAVFATQEQIEKITNLSYVKSIESMTTQLFALSKSKKATPDYSNSDIALLRFQTQRMQGDTFINHNLNGKGLRIAVFDVGFPGVDKHPAFAHLREEKKIIATYDFVTRSENVYKGHWHGTAALSCIGGKYDSINIGLATSSEFLLARTERILCERYSEEENWVAAAEWADRHGVNIISSSLGYTSRRYFNNQMDGHTSLVSRAANIAASKGILVINAAGNEGENDWKFIVAPADADSVLTVGGTDPKSDMHIYFSSFGPTSDGRLKPNVCAVGEAMVARSKGLAVALGTSFSTPLVAGFAACAWQSHPQWSNMDLFNAIEKSSHLYPYFDFAHGFGIPQAGRIIAEQKQIEPTFDFVIINNNIKIILREKFSHTEEEAALGYDGLRNFYYKVEDKNGVMKKYYIMLADRKEMLFFLTEDFIIGDVLTVHFEGYTNILDFSQEHK